MMVMKNGNKLGGHLARYNNDKGNNDNDDDDNDVNKNNNK